MSSYIHPLQSEYNKKVHKVMQQLRHGEVQLNSFVKVLTENQIKFFSKDDVTKFSKLINPFDKLNPRTAFVHLQLIYVHTNLDTKYFVVKYTGKQFKALGLKAIEVKKNAETHTIGLCLLDFKRKMEKLHGRENLWFKALGGIAGTNSIKRQTLQKKISKIFLNSCHTGCINRLLNYITGCNPEAEITWAHLQSKINLRNCCPISIQAKQLSRSASPTESIEKSRKEDPNALRISVFQSHDPKINELSTSQYIREGHTHSVMEEKPRRRLKTLIDRPKPLVQSCNLQVSIGPVNQQIIHSKNKYRYKILSSQKKCKTSLEHY